MPSDGFWKFHYTALISDQTPYSFVGACQRSKTSSKRCEIKYTKLLFQLREIEEELSPWMENARMEIMPIRRGKRACLILQCYSYSSALQFSFEFLSIVMHDVPLPIESLMWKKCSIFGGQWTEFLQASIMSYAGL